MRAIKYVILCSCFMCLLVGCQNNSPGTTSNIASTTSSIDTSIRDTEGVSSSNSLELTLENDELERCISEAILSENKSAFRYIETETYATESHKLLKKVINEDSMTVYLVALYTQYQSDGDEVKLTGAVCAPVSISFIAHNGEYIVDEYWIPEDGESYVQSIHDKFPSDIVEDALALEIPDGMETCEQNAKKHFRGTT